MGRVWSGWTGATVPHPAKALKWQRTVPACQGGALQHAHGLADEQHALRGRPGDARGQRGLDHLPGQMRQTSWPLLAPRWRPMLPSTQGLCPRATPSCSSALAVTVRGCHAWQCG